MNDRLDEIIARLLENDFQIGHRAAASAIAIDPEGGQVVLTDLGAWVQLTRHLVPRPLFESVAALTVVAETGLRINDRPLCGCRLAIDPHGLLLAHDLAPDAGADAILGAMWMTGVLEDQLLPLFDEAIERGERPTDERIDAALVA